VYLGKLDIKPCTGCSACLMNEGQCVIRDDMQGLYDKLLAADGLIVGSPTYFMDVSGAVKTFIDRTMAIRYRGIGPEYKAGMPWLGTVPLAGRPMVPVVTVAGAGHERAVETLKAFADDCHRMKIAARVVEVVGMNDVSDMPEVLQRAQDAGKKLNAALKKQ
jgi:multimeric flavodoxin WrbA